MSRTLAVVVLAPLLLASLAPVATAGSKNGQPDLSGGLYLFSRNVPVAGSTSGTFNAGILGLGYQMNGRLGSTTPWGWSVNAGYGLGDEKATFTSVTSSTNEVSLSHWDVRLGLDYYRDCCEDDFYCGPGLTYMSTTPTFKSTGNPDDKLKPTHLYGFDARLGGSIPLAGNMRLYGETSSFLGYGSYDETRGAEELKTTGWYTLETWRGGFRYKY